MASNITNTFNDMNAPKGVKTQDLYATDGVSGGIHSSNKGINTLQELVVSICDKLYTERQLITKITVKKLVQLHDLWSEEELELEIPIYINEWRLHNLQDGNAKQELCDSKKELAAAYATIRQLNAELTSLRLTVIQNLRGLLHD